MTSGTIFASSTTLSTRFLPATHATTTKGDNALRMPRPLGFVRLVKVKKLLAAPPVKQQP